MIDDDKAEHAKRSQDYDPNPPRCVTCVYHRHERQDRYIEREVRSRKGKLRIVRFKQKVHPLKNPMVDRCTFGNFIVKRAGVCNEWHSRDGERIEEPAQ